jgi:hypothetical protein
MNNRLLYDTSTITRTITGNQPVSTDSTTIVTRDIQECRALLDAARRPAQDLGINEDKVAMAREAPRHPHQLLSHTRRAG